MALIKCIECGHDVSDKASVCQYCGCPVEESLKNSKSSEPQIEEPNKVRPKVNKKVVIVFTLTIALLIVFAGIFGWVRFGNSIKAKNAYSIENYSEVISLLDNYDDLSSADLSLLNLAKAAVAYQNNDYFSALERLKNVKDDLYLEKAKELEASIQNMLFNQTQSQIEEALSTFNGINIVNEIDVYYGNRKDELENYVYDALRENAEEFNYDAFLCADKIVKQTNDNNFIIRLKDITDNDILRMKSFLNASWEWDNEYDSPNDRTKVVVHMANGNNSVGVLKNIGHLKEYYYCVDDVYWSDFVFNEGKDAGLDYDYSCYNMTRYSDGTIAGDIAVVHVDYDNNQLLLRVSNATDPDRIWKRVR